MSVPPRLRVVTVGNSIAVLVRPRPAGPDDLPYSRHLERELRARGHNAEVVNNGRWFDTVDQAYARWEQDVGAHSPDIVIVNFGGGECQPPILPYPLHRWILYWNPPLGFVRGRIRKAVIDVARPAIGWWTPRACRLLGQRGHKRSPKRFTAEMARMIGSTRNELQASVLVLGLTPSSGSHYEDFMPGIGQRVERYNRLLSAQVAALNDPRVRFVSLEPAMAKLGDVSKDGWHFTPDAHRVIATMLADEVEALVQ